MTFDSIVMAAVARELNNSLAGGRVDSIHQPSPLDLAVTVRNNSANYNLLISAEAQSPRIHLSSIKRPNPQTPPNFCMILRKYLKGARFVEAEQIDFDRVLHLKFSAYDGEKLTLVVEIMGKHSNVVLINDAGRILGTIKPVGRQKSRYREVLPGRQYVAPPSQNKINPLTVDKDRFDALLAETFSGEGDIASWLTKTFTGLSPFAARELTARSEGEVGILGDEFTELFADIGCGNFLPVLITNDMGQTIGFYAFPSVQHPEANQHERTSISIAAEQFYTSAIPRKAFDQEKTALIEWLKKEIAARERAIATIREGLAECEGAERHKQIGELILAQTASIPEAAESAELVDYYDPSGGTVTVKLDPQLSAPENAEAYFRKYQKSLTGAEALADRLEETEAELQLLKRVMYSADSITSSEQVAALRETLTTQGIQFRKQEQAETEKRKAEFDGRRISRVMSGDWEILVGQNSEANDYLLTRVAKSNDLWLHVKAAPSAHVVIRTNGKPDSVPRSVLQAAAELAVQHSDSKHSSLVPVDYTLRKYVRKPKGAPAGKAIYHNEKTVFITARV